jgi:hypothetical protein
MVKISPPVWGRNARIFPGRIDAVHEREPVVEDGDVRLGLACELDRALAVLGLRDHLPSRLATEDGVEAGTDNVMVVGDQDVGHDRRRPSERASFKPQPPRSARRGPDAEEAGARVGP